MLYEKLFFFFDYFDLLSSLSPPGARLSAAP